MAKVAKRRYRFKTRTRRGRAMRNARSRRRSKKQRRGRFVDYSFNVRKVYRQARSKYSLTRPTRHAMSLVIKNFCKKIVRKAGKHLKGKKRVLNATDIKKATLHLMPGAYTLRKRK